MSKRILITGAGGYIGSRMVERYLKEKIDVIALDRFFFGDVLRDLAKEKNLRIVKDDVRFVDGKIFKNVDCVIDLASISNDAAGSLNPRITKEINHKASIRIAKLAKLNGVSKYIFASSCSVYGKNDHLVTENSPTDPITEYAKSKVAAEKDLLKLNDSKFAVTILRNATVYGVSKRRMRFDLMINLMTLTAWRDNLILIYSGGKQWRPLVHIDDCIDAFSLVRDYSDINKIQGEIFNVGSNTQNYQVIRVAKIFKKYFPNIAIRYSKNHSESRDYHVDFTKISKTLGFKAKKTIEDGILDVKNSLDKKEIDFNIKTVTLDYYKYLIDADQILKFVKIKGKLYL